MGTPELEEQFVQMSVAVSLTIVSLCALDTTLRDVGAEHHADSGVSGEAPWVILSIWVPTIVLFQVSAEHIDIVTLCGL